MVEETPSDTVGARPLAQPLQEALERIRDQLVLHRGGLDDPPAPPPPLPPSLAVEALGLEKPAPEALAFAPRLFTQLALPYQDPGSDLPRWIRRNGSMTLVVNPALTEAEDGELVAGYPYGVIPRLVLIWVTTEVKQTGRREIVLGRSLREFVDRLGLFADRGGPRSDRSRVADQVERLFSASMTVTDRRTNIPHDFPEDDELEEPDELDDGALLPPREPKMVTLPARRTRVEHFALSHSFELWEAHTHGRKWEGSLVLSEQFYDSIRDGAVPLPRPALVELRLRTRSPLALDIYAWLAHRLHYVKKPTLIPWKELAGQFGGTYARTRDFKAQFLRELPHVLVVYSAAKVVPEKDGLRLRQSPTPIAPRASGRQRPARSRATRE